MSKLLKGDFEVYCNDKPINTWAHLSTEDVLAEMGKFRSVLDAPLECQGEWLENAYRLWREKKLVDSYLGTATEDELTKLAESVDMYRLPEATGEYLDVLAKIPTKRFDETDEEFKVRIYGGLYEE